jgi:hypothetical protein
MRGVVRNCRNLHGGYQSHLLAGRKAFERRQGTTDIIKARVFRLPPMPLT